MLFDLAIKMSLSGTTTLELIVFYLSKASEKIYLLKSSQISLYLIEFLYR